MPALHILLSLLSDHRKVDDPTPVVIAVVLTSGWTLWGTTPTFVCRGDWLDFTVVRARGPGPGVPHHGDDMRRILISIEHVERAWIETDPSILDGIEPRASQAGGG